MYYPNCRYRGSQDVCGNTTPSWQGRRWRSPVASLKPWRDPASSLSRHPIVSPIDHSQGDFAPPCTHAIRGLSRRPEPTRSRLAAAPPVSTLPGSPTSHGKEVYLIPVFPNTTRNGLNTGRARDLFRFSHCVVGAQHSRFDKRAAIKCDELADQSPMLDGRFGTD